MYIVVKMVWFIMFRYLLVMADKKISDIMCILTILIDTINNFFYILRKLKAVKRKNKKNKSVENSCTKKCIIVYDELIDIYKKKYNQFFESKSKDWRKNMITKI